MNRPETDSTLDPTDDLVEVCLVVDPAVAELARVLDPVAFDERAAPRNLGQLWDQTCRRMTARQHARRALDAGWTPPEPSPEEAP